MSFSKHSLLLVFALCVVSLLNVVALGQERTWTSANGNFKVEAQLVANKDGKLELRKKDGTILKLDASKLSVADNEFLKTLADDDDDGGDKITKEQKDKLKELGLKLAREEFSFLEEKKLKSEISKSLKAKKELIRMAMQLEEMRLQQLRVEDEIVGLKQQNIQLNAQLVNASSVKENNQLVGLINANMSAIELMDKEIENLGSELQQGQSFVNKSREQFIEYVMGVRELSDSFDEKMKTLPEDDEFKKLLSEIESTTQKTIKPFDETKSLSRLRENLSKLEQGVLSDTVPLRDDGSGTFQATVTINGESPIELVVDSGASMISLPQELAAELNIVVPKDARTVRLRIANGDLISARLVVLPEVRVGKFTARNVECAVLGAEAVNASGLLGMSFLGNFKFELDAAKGELKMMTVQEE